MQVPELKTARHIESCLCGRTPKWQFTNHPWLYLSPVICSVKVHPLFQSSFWSLLWLLDIKGKPFTFGDHLADRDCHCIRWDKGSNTCNRKLYIHSYFSSQYQTARVMAIAEININVFILPLCCQNLGKTQLQRWHVWNWVRCAQKINKFGFCF